MLEISLLYKEIKKLKERTKKYSKKMETYSEKTDGFIIQICELLDKNSQMEEKILNEMAEQLKKRGNNNGV
jgi:uncharacterized coiled-coil DUF342 family protein